MAVVIGMEGRTARPIQLPLRACSTGGGKARVWLVSEGWVRGATLPSAVRRRQLVCQSGRSGRSCSPVDEGGLVAEMVQAFADARMWFGVHEGLHRGAPGPGADAPPGVVRVGERVHAEIAV